MKYKILEMNFYTSVHFGDGNLQKSKNTICADTIFSALCHEALKMGKQAFRKMTDFFETGQLCISDGLPYIENEYYVPKPLLHIENSRPGDSVLKKALKKVSYIPVSGMDDYINGNLDVLETARSWSRFGHSDLLVKASVSYGEEAMPYDVGVYSYGENCGLYLCVGYETEEALTFIHDLFKGLSYVGIGGKVSAGLGKFHLRMKEIPEDFEKRLTDASMQTYMTLSVSLPKDEELDAVLPSANYLLVKRSGFIVSSAAEENRKKKDIYLLSAGAVFEKKFGGAIYDVSNKWLHPVFCYAKPLFMGVK